MLLSSYSTKRLQGGKRGQSPLTASSPKSQQSTSTPKVTSPTTKLDSSDMLQASGSGKSPHVQRIPIKAMASPRATLLSIRNDKHQPTSDISPSQRLAASHRTPQTAQAVSSSPSQTSSISKAVPTMLRPTILSSTACSIRRSHSNGRGASTPRHLTFDVAEGPAEVEATPHVTSPIHQVKELDVKLVRHLDASRSFHSNHSGPLESPSSHHHQYNSQFGSVVSSRYISRAGSPTFDRSQSLKHIDRTPSKEEIDADTSARDEESAPSSSTSHLSKVRRTLLRPCTSSPFATSMRRGHPSGSDIVHEEVEDEDEQPLTVRTQVPEAKSPPPVEDSTPSAPLSSFLATRVSKAPSPTSDGIPSPIAIAARSMKKLTKKDSQAAVARISSHLQKQHQTKKEDQEHRRLERELSSRFDSNSNSLRSEEDSPLHAGKNIVKDERPTATIAKDDKIVVSPLLVKKGISPQNECATSAAPIEPVPIPHLNIPNPIWRDEAQHNVPVAEASVPHSSSNVLDIQSPRALCVSDTEARDACDILLKAVCVVIPLWPQQTYSLLEVKGVMPTREGRMGSRDDAY